MYWLTMTFGRMRSGSHAHGWLVSALVSSCKYGKTEVPSNSCILKGTSLNEMPIEKLVRLALDREFGNCVVFDPVQKLAETHERLRGPAPSIRELPQAKSGHCLEDVQASIESGQVRSCIAPHP